MTIAVTAASGQLGRQTVRSLIALSSDESVIGLARTPAKASDLGVDVRPGDYDAPDQLKSSLEGVDTLLLISGIAAPQERVEQHRNVIAAAVSADVKKIVFTSIQGPEEGTEFSEIVQSNRQTEADIRSSGINWLIGRNGIYIDPDVDYIETYRTTGMIANSAGDGRCGYVTRSELSKAYAQLLTSSAHDNKILELNGEPITQRQLADYLNTGFGTQLTYQEMTPEQFRQDRIAELGEFFGPIIAGIYDGIRLGANDAEGDFETVMGRPHVSWQDYFGQFANSAE